MHILYYLHKCVFLYLPKFLHHCRPVLRVLLVATEYYYVMDRP